MAYVAGNEIQNEYGKTLIGSLLFADGPHLECVQVGVGSYI